MSSLPDGEESGRLFIHNSGMPANTCRDGGESIFTPVLFTGSLGWERLTIKASVLYLAYFFLYGCVIW